MSSWVAWYWLARKFQSLSHELYLSRSAWHDIFVWLRLLVTMLFLNEELGSANACVLHSATGRFTVPSHLSPRGKKTEVNCTMGAGICGQPLCHLMFSLPFSRWCHLRHLCDDDYIHVHKIKALIVIQKLVRIIIRTVVTKAYSLEVYFRD